MRLRRLKASSAVRRYNPPSLGSVPVGICIWVAANLAWAQKQLGFEILGRQVYATEFIKRGQWLYTRSSSLSPSWTLGGDSI